MYEREKYLLLKDLDVNFKKVLIETKARIIGGAIRSVFTRSKINDYDIFFQDKKGLAKAYKFLTSASIEESKNKKGHQKDRYKEITMTDNAYSFYRSKNNTKIQLVNAFISKDIDCIFSKFDFTVCMGAYDFETNTFTFGDRFFRDNASKKLIINSNTEYPINTMIRIRKYIRKGYTISGLEMVKLALKINNLKIDNHNDLKRHLMGIDTTILKDFFDQNGKPIDDDILKNIKYEFSKIIDQINSHIDKYYGGLLDWGEGNDPECEY